MKRLFFILAVLMLVFYITACAQKLQKGDDVAVNAQDAAASSAKQAIAENNSEFDELANTDALDSSMELIDLVE